MSKIHKKPILIPKNVEIKIEDKIVKIKGPKGEIQKEVSRKSHLEIKENKLFVLPPAEGSLRPRSEVSEARPDGRRESFKTLPPKIKSILGLYYRIFKNDISGVVSGFEKKLEIQGIGFRAQLENNGDLLLKVGFSHPVIIKKEKGLSFSVEKNIITVAGIEKEKVGNLAVKIRRVKPPDPYKGKGIRYLGERVRKKEGKRVATVTGA